MTVDRYDLVVVGGGPAGCFAARELARAGVSVLLLDRGPRPRWKVCGACVGPDALTLLTEAGLGGLARSGVPVRSVRVETSSRSVVLPGRPDARVAWSRSEMDDVLWGEAASEGAMCLSSCRATIGWLRGDWRRVVLTGPGAPPAVDARVVVDAAGLAGAPTMWTRPGPGPGGPTDPRGGAARVSAAERVGVGAIFADVRLTPTPGVEAGKRGRGGSDEADVPAGTLRMLVGRSGYVGMVRLADGAVDVAAAVGPPALKEMGTDGAVRSILGEVGFDLHGDLLHGWRGTPVLGRRPAWVAAPRVFRIGDAQGYVEPFTGEGIGWALRSARDVVPYVLRGVREWTPDLEQRWARHVRGPLARERFACRAVAWGVRRPRVLDAALRVLGRWPALASPFGVG